MNRPPPIVVPRALECDPSVPSLPVISEIRYADREHFFEPRPRPVSWARPPASPLRNDLSHQLAAICIRSPTHGVGAEYLSLRARSGGAEAPWRDRAVGYNSQDM